MALSTMTIAAGRTDLPDLRGSPHCASTPRHTCHPASHRGKDNVEDRDRERDEESWMLWGVANCWIVVDGPWESVCRVREDTIEIGVEVEDADPRAGGKCWHRICDVDVL